MHVSFDILTFGNLSNEWGERKSGMDSLILKLFLHRLPATNLGWPHTAVTAQQDDEHAPQTELQRKRRQQTIETWKICMNMYLIGRHNVH